MRFAAPASRPQPLASDNGTLFALSRIMATGHTEDTFLTEQLNRIRGLSDRLSEACERVAQSREALEREMDMMRSGPLQRIRDYRTHSSQRDHDERRAQAADAPRESSGRKRHR
jgi:hypothetical protein